MSDYDDDLDGLADWEDDDSDVPAYVPDDPDNTPKALRRAAREGKRAKQEADALRRELAFVKAGVDTSTKLGAMFATAYTGELTEEAVRASWAEILPGAGTFRAADVDEDGGPIYSDYERASTRERQALANNATGWTPAPKLSPTVAATQAADIVRADGGSDEDASAAWVVEKTARELEGRKGGRPPGEYGWPIR